MRALRRISGTGRPSPPFPSRWRGRVSWPLLEHVRQAGSPARQPASAALTPKVPQVPDDVGAALGAAERGINPFLAADGGTRDHGQDHVSPFAALALVAGEAVGQI